ASFADSVSALVHCSIRAHLQSRVVRLGFRYAGVVAGLDGDTATGGANQGSAHVATSLESSLPAGPFKRSRYSRVVSSSWRSGRAGARVASSSSPGGAQLSGYPSRFALSIHPATVPRHALYHLSAN